MSAQTRGAITRKLNLEKLDAYELARRTVIRLSKENDALTAEVNRLKEALQTERDASAHDRRKASGGGL